MTTREALHRLIDELSEDESEFVRAFIAQFVSFQRGKTTAPAPAEPDPVLDDPMLAVLRSAPEDDEPSTREEDASADEGWREYRRGDYISRTQAQRSLLGPKS